MGTEYWVPMSEVLKMFIVHNTEQQDMHEVKEFPHEFKALPVLQMNGTYIATSHRVTYCSSAEISGMLAFIWNARKLLSQPVELFMQYVRLSVSLNSCFLPAHYGKTATNKLCEIA